MISGCVLFIAVYLDLVTVLLWVARGLYKYEVWRDQTFGRLDDPLWNDLGLDVFQHPIGITYLEIIADSLRRMRQR